MTRSEWTDVVGDMVSRGAQGSQEDLNTVVTYLSVNFGKDRPAASNAAPVQAPAPAVEQNETPLSEAEVLKGKELVKANGCLSCHRIGETGSYLGPDLTDIGAHRSAEQLRTSLVSPEKEVLLEDRSEPDREVLLENRPVRLVTRDGKTVTGKLLNQDSFTVQLIDSSNQLRSFQKSSLREFVIVTTNPMTAYTNRISAQDLRYLVNYLRSLKGIDNP